MKINMIFCALVATVSLHVQASPTDTQNSMWSSWTHNVINNTSSDIYFGSDVLYTESNNLVKANSTHYYNQKTPANKMEFIYDKNKNVMFSTVDNNGVGVSTVTAIKWKNNKPDSVADCYSVMTNFDDDYGFDLEYSGSNMRMKNFDKTAIWLVLTPQTCSGNLEYAKSHIPNSINKS